MVVEPSLGMMSSPQSRHIRAFAAALARGTGETWSAWSELNRRPSHCSEKRWGWGSERWGVLAGPHHVVGGIGREAEVTVEGV